MVPNVSPPRARPSLECSPSRRSRNGSDPRPAASPVVAQDFGSKDKRATVSPRREVPPAAAPPATQDPSSSSRTTTKASGLTLPPAVRTPPSPTQSCTKATTTPPTPTSTQSREGGTEAGENDGRRLDEFGLPRISPPTGYFDGDNEHIVEADGRITATEEGASRPSE
ncbi:hypothetical protein JCM16303_004845 [Sporobolomyces ruberrimus]